MSVSALEARVFELEELRLCVRVPTTAMLAVYPYQRKAPDKMTLTEYLDNRIRPITGTLEVYVVNGRGEIVHGRTKLENIRNTYVVD